MLVVFQILTRGKNLKWPNFGLKDLPNFHSMMAELLHLLPMFKGSTPQQVLCSIMVIKTCIVQDQVAVSATLHFLHRL
jgi:hypothetical protein